MTDHTFLEGISLDPYIDGERLSLSGHTHPTFDPATGEIICEVPVSDADIVNKAVDSSRKALRAHGRKLRQQSEAAFCYVLPRKFVWMRNGSRTLNRSTVASLCGGKGRYRDICSLLRILRRYC